MNKVHLAESFWIPRRASSGQPWQLIESRKRAELDYLVADGRYPPILVTALCRRRGKTYCLEPPFSPTAACVRTDGVRAVRIDSSGRMHVLWHASSSITGSPVIGGGMLWTLDTGSGVLHGLGPSHGIERAAVSVGAVTRFATPALSGRRILIGTSSGLTVLGY